MRYLNSRLLTLLAVGLSLAAVPGLAAQDPAPSAAAAPIRGDVDGDGRVTGRDAEAVRAYLVRGTVPAGGAILPGGDANGDGRITSADAVLISRFVAGVDVSRFGLGRPVGDGGAQGPAAGGRVLALYECTGDVAAGTLSCAPATPEAGEARLDVILGSPNVTIASTATVLSRNGVGEDTTTSSVTLKNNIGQPIGTTDGTNAASSGTRMFFTAGPTVTSVNSGTIAGSTVRVDNQDGIATFVNGSVTHANKKYFQYDGVLATAATSAADAVRFVYSANVKTFKYSVLVSAPVQYEHGWITVTPATPVIGPGGTVALSTASFSFTGAAIASDPVTWSSSDPGVPAVDGSGVVTGIGEGSATITATSIGTPLRTGRAVVTVDAAPTLASTTPANGASSVSPGDNIQIAFSEAVAVADASFQLECPTGSAVGFSVGGSGTSTITLNPTADLPSGITCQVTVVASGVSDADINDGPDKLAANYVFSFDVSIEAVPDAFGTTTTGNVRIHSESTSPSFSVTANDKIPASASISFAGWNGTSGKTQNGGDVSMTTSGEGRGLFIYNPPAGFDGIDSLQYTVQVGAMTSSAKVALPVSGMIWFVNNAGASCTTRASGCGRLTTPYSSLAAFNAENTGSGNNPAAGDAVFLYESASTYTGPVALLAQQKLIGQDAGASLSTITGITPATGSDALPAMNTGGSTVTIAGASGGVVLANIGANTGVNNTVRGLAIATTGGTALSGTGFGTPNIAEVPISATGGAALSLDNGTLNSTFPSVSSTNSTGRGISLTSVNGSPTFTAGSISGAAQAAFFVSGGGVGFTWPGSIGQANNAPLVDVQGSHTGALTFSGALTATNGTGLQFNAAQGAYTFSGSASLGGTDAGVDITNGSGGTFTFGTGTAITNSAGTGVNVYGSAPTVTYSGSITKSGTSTGRLVEVGEQTGGTVTFNTGTLSATSSSNLSTGISLSNADGTVTFAGSVALSGGDAGVDIVSGSSGNIDFNATTIQNPANEALRIFNGAGGDQAADVTFAGSITTNAGRPVLIEDVSSGSVAVSASINATAGLGMLVQNNSGGTMTFSNATQTLSTAANPAVTLANNTGATVNFTGGSLVINTTAGAGLNASGGGTVNVTGAANRVTSTGGGTAVSIQNTTIGGIGVSFFSVNASGGGTNGIVLANTGAGSFQVTGDGASDLNNTTRGRTTAKSGGGSVVLGSGGTITAKPGDGVNLNTTGAVTLRNMVITNGSADGIDASGVSGLVLDNLQVTGHTNNRGVSAATTSGLKIFHSEISSNATSAAAGSASLYNLQLVDVTGTDSIMSSLLQNSFGFVARVGNSSGTLNLRVENSTITGATNGIAFGIYPSGTSNVTANFQNDSIGHSSARGIQAATGTSSSAVFNLTVNNTALRNNFVGIDNAHGSSGTYTFNITNNRLQTNVVSSAQAINVNRLGSPSFNAFGLYSGTISGNLIGTAGTANSGSDVGDGINVESNGSGGITRVAILNNTIREVGQRGIYLAAVDTDVGGATASTLEARVQGNSVSNMEASALHGIQALLGALATDNPVMCFNISGNTITAPFNGIRMRTSGIAPSSSTPTLRLQGWDGVTAVATYLQANNPAATGASGNISYSQAGGTTSAATCTTP